MTISIQAETEILEMILETVKICETWLVIFVERQKPRCLWCGQKCHIRAECTPPKNDKELVKIIEEEVEKEMVTSKIETCNNEESSTEEYTLIPIEEKKRKNNTSKG